MTNSFLDELDIEDKKTVSELRRIILSANSSIYERMGKIMSNEGAFIYEQEGVFKYGLAKTSKHFTFHSMVMYAFPEVMELSKKLFTGKGTVFQKGCINFKTLDSIPIKAFKEVLKFSDKQDFSTVINHYKNKKK